MRIALVVLIACAPSALHPDVAKIADTHAWTVANAETHAAVEDGKQIVRLAPIGGNHQASNVAIAMVAGLTLDRGSIEVDLRGRGDGEASFLGIAFGVADANRYEAVYFRPFRFRSSDALVGEPDDHRGLITRRADAHARTIGCAGRCR
jgi:hypothetical protein